MSKDDKIANLEQENAQLKTQLSMLQSMLYGSKSEKRKQADIPDNQLSIFAQDKEQKNGAFSGDYRSCSQTQKEKACTNSFTRAPGTCRRSD
ncbi:hypothetical protein MY04_1207 [Flammeovirga sp. MY04]|uniref:IS66 family transposase n=1 Tax=Flammeovirga sp. MY04 TaxID=1191459 RepID=UPI00080630E9|nr:hypothetical protein [Flammeovirga sp. MY04]ANQ48584.1 hypothetical protein MY04_1207 [Flammeovirga sp. MY04]